MDDSGNEDPFSYLPNPSFKEKTYATSIRPNSGHKELSAIASSSFQELETKNAIPRIMAHMVHPATGDVLGIPKIRKPQIIGNNILIEMNNTNKSPSQSGIPYYEKPHVIGNSISTNDGLRISKIRKPRAKLDEEDFIEMDNWARWWMSRRVGKKNDSLDIPIS